MQIRALAGSAVGGGMLVALLAALLAQGNASPRTLVLHSTDVAKTHSPPLRPVYLLCRAASLNYYRNGNSVRFIHISPGMVK